MDDGRLLVFTRHLHSHHLHGEIALDDVTDFFSADAGLRRLLFEKLVF